MTRGPGPFLSEAGQLRGRRFQASFDHGPGDPEGTDGELDHLVPELGIAGLYRLCEQAGGLEKNLTQLPGIR